jgi:sialidase-1
MDSRITRRRALTLPWVASLLAGRAAAAPAARIASVTTISQRPEYYHGWPTVTRRASGELLVVCSGGRETHVCPFGWVELMRSHDDGKTWSFPEVLLDSAIDDRDAGVCETSRGSLLVTTFTSLAYVPSLEKAQALPPGSPNAWPAERLRRWQAAHTRLGDAERKALLGTWMLRSADGGVTWSAPFRVPVNSPHGPIALSGGRLLYLGKELWSSPSRIGAAESTDDGVHWRWISEIPTRTGDNPADYHELHAVETAGRRIVVHIRNHNSANAGETLQCESSDGGKTWSTPHQIGVWGLPSHLLRLRDGRLLMTYGYRRKPFGNQARVSEDHGRAWSEPIVISQDGGGSDLGYPSTVELADRSLLTVWYEQMAGAPQAVLRQARWSLAG